MPGRTVEIELELPDSLPQIAGGGKLSPVKRARISVAVPENFRPVRARPIVIVKATTDVAYRSSRRLAGFYTAAVLAAGWIVLAADPVEEIAQDDGVYLRIALALGAVAVLARAPE